jgi:hypothetical protein
MISSQLPPWITPTLPEATTLPSSTLPPHITPTLPETSTTTTPSGLIVVRNELSQVSTGAKLVVVTSPLEGNAAVDAAKAAHAELAAAHGAVAADVVYAEQLQLAQGIRNDELRAQAVAALLAGDVAGAAKLITQQG